MPSAEKFVPVRLLPGRSVAQGAGWQVPHVRSPVWWQLKHHCGFALPAAAMAAGLAGNACALWQRLHSGMLLASVEACGT